MTDMGDIVDIVDGGGNISFLARHSSFLTNEFWINIKKYSTQNMLSEG
jgi:hypothetical protein